MTKFRSRVLAGNEPCIVFFWLRELSYGTQSSSEAPHLLRCGTALLPLGCCQIKLWMTEEMNLRHVLQSLCSRRVKIVHLVDVLF